MILMGEAIFQHLKELSFVQVPFPIDPFVLRNAIDSFLKFLEEPDEIKKQIDFTIAPKHRRGDVGFKHRDPADHVYNDSKEFFHFHPALFKKYEQFLSENPVVSDFVTKAKPIWDLAYETVYGILKIFEKQFTGIVDKVFATENVHLLLRFLKYDWQESGKYLAKPHFDAGSFTLAIAESCPGLRIGSSPDDLKIVEHKEGHAIFMLSSNYKQVIPSDEFSPGWHDVIQLDETLIGKPFARWAIVAFIEAHGVKALPRTETHKWYVGSA
ncbi:hypothetical protein [Legionella micdadei]|uniref:Isopenicillin N synthase-like Fe(2+) 2OG dioxygenase domain-containing protein n=1 Tax=Legionella micdadei TaxID=451 RepID=A0A098GGP0_LEGMI|nr:hypothetical protein [Legionella micdadei]ARG97377.1 hypothetical protein B6N58_06700 [Legionella micdadei]ARH00315.1 hypothetical protein B6V88_07720 [Legionella micdadei]KTD28263.1 hypothetical protein Lmic_1374 [Legionella micdadei]NSL16891.1 hypothetical protein [Legionella micdadei]CEG61150.1 protein of unknown function [Legionella micdadei]